MWRALVHENLRGQIAAELGSRRRVLICWAQNACVLLFSGVYAWLDIISFSFSTWDACGDAVGCTSGTQVTL